MHIAKSFRFSFGSIIFYFLLFFALRLHWGQALASQNEILWANAKRIHRNIVIIIIYPLSIIYIHNNDMHPLMLHVFAFSQTANLLINAKQNQRTWWERWLCLINGFIYIEIFNENPDWNLCALCAPSQPPEQWMHRNDTNQRKTVWRLPKRNPFVIYNPKWQNVISTRLSHPTKLLPTTDMHTEMQYILPIAYYGCP